jgi:hypothetical protein
VAGNGLIATEARISVILLTFTTCSVGPIARDTTDGVDVRRTEDDVSLTRLASERIAFRARTLLRLRR